ncbi:hypothetical protein LO80_03275 [Candidatus Francisella endociliophora]|uniref:Uncharacterized protein n=1 Tax=Candidatus Francisella endociliophora TaxID=653937 RepID=A0A097ENF1_9GAMM|nr:hypothetical protein [Francisella sp. FSC1006]AIT09089.1 hypothetical protein LO80_03275 [Francisella sp. FSC1006]
MRKYIKLTMDDSDYSAVVYIDSDLIQSFFNYKGVTYVTYGDNDLNKRVNLVRETPEQIMALIDEVNR